MFIKTVFQYKKYGKYIYKVFHYIKDNPGCTITEIRRDLNLPTYKSDVVIYNLTYMCYLWEDCEIIKNKEISHFYIDGNFFDDYIKIFSIWSKDEKFKNYDRNSKN